jgi:hypothetical protein
MAKKKAQRTSRASTVRETDDYNDTSGVASARKSRAGASSSSSAMDEDETMESNSSRTGHRDYKIMIKEFAANPAVRYVAGGIATAILSRVATNLSHRYPEISRFISENLDGLEGKLGEFKNNLNSDQVSQH